MAFKMTNNQVKFITFFVVGLISSAALFFVYSRPGVSGGAHSRSGMYIKYDEVAGCYYLEGTAGFKTSLSEKNADACVKKSPKASLFSSPIKSRYGLGFF